MPGNRTRRGGERQVTTAEQSGRWDMKIRGREGERLVNERATTAAPGPPRLWLYPVMEVLSWLRPARTVPITRWRCSGRWKPTPLAFVVLVVGLSLFGLGDALIVQGGIGVSPWTVLAQGMATRLPISIGVATLIVGVVVLLMWIPIREKPGLGTIMNILVISVMLQVGVTVIPAPDQLALRLLYVLGGIALIGLGSGLYLTTNLGPGPRDGWMTGLHQRTGWPVARVRTGIELIALGIGWLLGGTVGVGTVLFAVLIGPAVAYGLMFIGAVGRVPHTPEEVISDDEFPELDA